MASENKDLLEKVRSRLSRESAAKEEAARAAKIIADEQQALLADIAAARSELAQISQSIASLNTALASSMDSVSGLHNTTMAELLESTRQSIEKMNASAEERNDANIKKISSIFVNSIEEIKTCIMLEKVVTIHRDSQNMASHITVKPSTQSLPRKH